LRPIIAALLFLAPALAFGSEYTIGPAPRWIDRLSVDTTATLPANEVRLGTYALLDDHQVSAGSATTDYHRRVRKVVSPAGVQNGSEIAFDFDPSYQKLVIHDITIRRGGELKQVLEPASIRVIEKEDGQSDHLYDGMLSAVAFLKDVRPGDILDYSWSLEGSNALLGGRFADTFDLTADVPTRLIRHRLIFPASRPLHYRSTLPGIEPTIANGTYTWTRTNVPALDVEDNTPDWFDAYDHVQVSEFASWHDVALWADALFQMNDASRAAVAKLAGQIRAEHPQQRDQIAASIRFVQDQVRYLGIEMGRNSHEPHQPSEVLEQRWGDCKDKAFLLAALLRELGVEAYPALVNTKLRHNMDRELPSPFEFDHVITEVLVGSAGRIGGATQKRTYWIDSTLADQGGTLDTIETPNDERALVVRKDTPALATIETNQKGSTSIAMTYTTKSWDAPTSLGVVTTYSGADADAIRASIAGMSLADIAKERINRLAVDQPKIAADAAPLIRDDRTHNVVVIAERYTVRDLWRDGFFAFTPHSIEDRLKHPDTVIRAMPLSFPYPLAIHQRVAFHLPAGVSVEGTGDEVSTPAFRYLSNVADDGKTVTVDYDLRALRDGIAAKDVPDHLTRVNAILDGTGITLTRRTRLEAATSLTKTAVPGSLLVLVLLAAAVRHRGKKVEVGKLS
jgi:transglutaminase-like putative cysteine protease